MPNLSDSCWITRLPTGVRKLAEEAQMSFPLSLRSFVAAAPCPHRHCLTLHLKLLVDPPAVTGAGGNSIRDMLVSMRTVYETGDIGVSVGSRENLTGTAFATLLTVDVGTCGASGAAPTAEQNQLFGNRNGAATNHVVIYFTTGTNPALNGCANHPKGRPGAVVAAPIASRWTLAHETAHVLGVGHIAGEKDAAGTCTTPDFTRLMTGCSTSQITGKPTLSAAETAVMRASASVYPCPR